MLSNRMEGNKHSHEWSNECVSSMIGTDRGHVVYLEFFGLANRGHTSSVHLCNVDSVGGGGGLGFERQRVLK